MEKDIQRVNVVAKFRKRVAPDVVDVLIENIEDMNAIREAFPD